jgi:hypothetical protein
MVAPFGVDVLLLADAPADDTDFDVKGTVRIMNIILVLTFSYIANTSSQRN